MELVGGHAQIGLDRLLVEGCELPVGLELEACGGALAAVEAHRSPCGLDVGGVGIGQGAPSQHGRM